MKTLLLLGCIAVVLSTGCATTRTADLSASEPLVALMKVAPGYKREISLGTPGNNVVQVRIALLSQNPSKKWKPTAFLALRNDSSDVSYYLNLSVDTELQRQYVRASLINDKEQRVISSQTYQELLDLSSENLLKIEFAGRNIRSFINGKLIEEHKLPFDADYYDIGASSGSYKITVLEDPPLPSAE